MTNTTKNTTKSIFLALSVALTMGVANAASVPGIPTNTFEFNQIGSDATPTSGAGFNAISNVNDILGSLHTTGGSDINVDNYWKSFVKPNKQQTFDYASAKPMIDELVFTVLGEAYGQQLNTASVGWAEASTVKAYNADGTEKLDGSNGYIDAKTNFLTSNSKVTGTYTEAEAVEAAGFAAGDVKTAAVLGTDGTVLDVEVLYTQAEQDTAAGFVDGETRKWRDGKLEESGEAAILLLERIGFTGTTTPLGSYTITTVDTTGQDVELRTNPTDYVAPLDNDAAKDKLINTVLAANGVSMNGSVVYQTSFSDYAKAARVDAIAFNNANNLIGQIALQLKNGYLLDVVAATNAVDGIIEHHNNFLAASLIDEAKKLKNVMKSIGLQTAAATIGKTAGDANICGIDGGRSTEVACVKVGEAFKDISLDLSTVRLNTDASRSFASVEEYNNAIDAINTFAGNLTTFNNGAVAGYTASASQTDIYNQFGDIMVIDGSEVDNALDGSLTDGGTGTLASHNPYTTGTWTDETAFEITGGFTGLFDLNTDGDNDVLTGTDDLVELH